MSYSFAEKSFGAVLSTLKKSLAYLIFVNIPPWTLIRACTLIWVTRVITQSHKSLSKCFVKNDIDSFLGLSLLDDLFLSPCLMIHEMILPMLSRDGVFFIIFSEVPESFLQYSTTLYQKGHNSDFLAKGWHLETIKLHFSLRFGDHCTGSDRPHQGKA